METETQHDWYEEKPLDQITVGELENLCKIAFEQRAKIDELSKQLKAEEKRSDGLEATIMTVLEKFGKTSYKSAFANFFTSENLMVTQPATPEKKLEFRAYLKAQGLEDMLSVNSNTLRSWVKAHREAAFTAGGIPEPIPGLDEPTIVKRLNMRKVK